MKKLLLLFLLLPFFASAQNNEAQIKTFINAVRTGPISQSKIANALDQLNYNKRGLKEAYTASGTNTYTVTVGVGVTSLSDGVNLLVKFTNANTTTTPTLNPNGIGATALKDNAGNDLSIGDIKAGGIYALYYNGIHFRMLNIGTGSGGSVDLKTIENNSLLGTGNIDLTKTDVGLGNVDNTSDASKPVSTATQTALDLKERRNTYNMLDYGCVGDGTTDNSAALQALIDLMPTNSVVKVPIGTFNFNSTIHINKNISFEGLNRAGSVFVMDENDTLLRFVGVGGAQINNIVIRDMVLYNTNAGTPASGSVGIYGNTLGMWLIDNIYMSYFYNNIVVENSVWMTYHNIFFIGWVNAAFTKSNTGIYTDAGDDSWVSCEFVPNRFNCLYSFYQQNGGGSKFTNCKFNYSNEGGGVAKKAQWHIYYNMAGNTVDLNISNNSLENPSVGYIRIGRTSGTFSQVAISNNDIGGTSTANVTGISLTSVDEVTITGNTFRASTANTTAIVANTVDGLHVANNSFAGWTSNYSLTNVTNFTTPVVSSAVLTPSVGDYLGRQASGWVNRTGAQVLSDIGAAPLSSPVFTDNPTAPTASPGDNDFSIANTAFVTTAVNDAVIAAGSVDDFTDLTDVPSSYSGQGSKVVSVKSDETGLEFSSVGGLNLNGYLSVTGTTSLSASDYYKTIACSGTTSDYTVTLPTAVGHAGEWFQFRGVAALTKIITVDANSTETINGILTRQFVAKGGFRIVSDGSNWMVISEIPSPIPYTPTFVGFPSASFDCRYVLNGRIMTIYYYVISTSGSGSTASMTIPAGFAANMYANNSIRAKNNTFATNAPFADIASTLSTITFYTAANGTGWTNATAREVYGQLSFEIQ